MEERLRSSWSAYASLLVADDQGSMDIDTLIITHDRLILVELKEWTGALTSSDGKWFINGKSRGKSPYEIKRVHALRLTKLLERELSHKLGYAPAIEAHIVLCGSATPELLTGSERRFVHTLEAFLDVATKAGYEKIVSNRGTNLDNLFDKLGKPRPNSEKCLPIFQEFFAGPRVTPQKLKHHNYVVSDSNPWFKHRSDLYNEYRSQHQERVHDVALLRRWDFSMLGIEHATHAQWANIGLRENRVIGHVKDINTGLEEYMLRPLVPLGEDDVEEDFIEMYELKRTYQRLDEMINSRGAAATPEQRLDWLRSTIAPFASLHSLGIGHRDIGLHNLWFAKEQNSVVISGLAAAFFPERGTLVGVRRLLQASRVTAPEDIVASEGELIDPFRLDVFLLGMVSYSLLFASEQLAIDSDGFIVWQDPVTDPFGGRLDCWIKRALALDPLGRFANAAEMLTELNALTVSPTHQVDDDGALGRILTDPFLKKDWSPFTLWSKYQPLPGEVLGSGQKMSYRFQGDGGGGLCKFWPQIRPDKSTPGLNRRLDQFRKRLEKMRSGSLPTPKLIDFGLIPGGGLFVTTEYEVGAEWKSYILQQLSFKQAMDIALALVSSVTSCHEAGVAHGDLHPDNILITNPEGDGLEAGESLQTVRLIDMADFGGEEEAHNVEYGPPNPSVTDSFGRDRYAVYKLVSELAGVVEGRSSASSTDEVYAEPLKDLMVKLGPVREELRAAGIADGSIPASLEPLRDALIETLLEPEATVRVVSPLLVYGTGGSFSTSPRRLEQDNGCYYFKCKRDQHSKELINCYFTGSVETVTVQVDPTKREITRTSVRSGSFADLVSAFRDHQVKVVRPIDVQTRSYGEPGDLVDFIFSIDPVVELLAKMFSPNNVDDTGQASAEVGLQKAPSAREIWAAIRDTEADTLLSLEIGSGDIEESRAGFLLVPYLADTGRPLDFTSQERVFVTIEGDERGLTAELELSETTKDKIALRGIRAGYRPGLRPGVCLRLESQASKSSRDVRTKSINRVLDGASVIPDIAMFFDSCAADCGQVQLADRPSEALLRTQYDSADKQLNDKQVLAFQTLASMGPIGVLQGPPGTGKTAFVSKFIHYLFLNQRVANVLLVGQSHTSVDNVASLTRQVCADRGLNLEVVRIGQERMIATEMLDSHSKALQRQIRHSFHREFEHRIKALTPQLGLPSSFVDAAVSAHRELALLVVSLGAAERSRTSRLTSLVLPDEDSLEEATVVSARDRTDLDDRVSELSARLQAAMSRLEPAVSLEGLGSANAWSRYMDELNKRHGIGNLAAADRLSALLTLSQEWLDILGAGEANYDQFLVKTRQLVCGTLVGMGNRQVGLSETVFDWVIVDEAARAQAGELMVAMQTAKRVLLVGDHRQLPPHYNRGHLEKAAKQLRVGKNVLEKTDFQRAFESTNGLTLDTQYRMCQPISDLVSSCFYREDVGLLNTGRGSSPDWYETLPKPLSSPVVWIDSGSDSHLGNEKDPTGKSQFFNEAEAEITLNVLRILAQEEFAVRLRESVAGSDKQAIGIITMYRAQKELLESKLSKAEWALSIRDMVKIDTVDSYQGKENKVVILSLVRDNDTGRQGFLHEDPRVNVSISRAEERLIIIGAGRMWTRWNQSSAVGSVLRFVEARVAAGDTQYCLAAGSAVGAAAHG